MDGCVSALGFRYYAGTQNSRLSSLTPYASPKTSRMDQLLHPRVHPHQPPPKLRVVPPQHPSIPRRRHKQRIDSTPHRRHKHPRNLQPDQKRKRHYYRGKPPISVVGRVSEAQVQVSEQGAGVGDEGGGHGEHGADEAVVDEGVDAPLFEERPGVAGGGEVGFAVEGDVGEGVAVDESKVGGACVSGYALFGGGCF